MERGKVVFTILFLVVPLALLAAMPMLGAGAAMAALFTAVIILLVGFTMAIAFVDVA